MVGIYKIKNIKNRKVYIGKSKNLENRWDYHKTYYNSKQKRFINNHLYNSMKKYGIENFCFKIIKVCNLGELDNLEIYYINKYKSYNRDVGYNKTIGGEGGDTFNMRCEESKKLTKEKHRKLGKIDPKGIINFCIKGQHITKSAPHIKEKWNRNFTKAMEKSSIRKSRGDFTEKELEGHEIIRLKSIGKKNPRYKGSYLIYSPDDILIGKYESLRIAVKETGWPYTSLNKRVLDGKIQDVGKFKGYRVIRKK